jgi:hypothetical protein
MNPTLRSLLEAEISAYQNMVRETGYRPPIWILPDPSCALLKKICRFLSAEPLAFEFGSGRSTLALRSVCSGVTSVEDSPEWLEKTEELPGQVIRRPLDLTSVVSLSPCRLGFVPYRSFQLESRLDLLQRLENADLILVDSPPNPATREHALFIALQHARTGAVIVLDDMDVNATRRFAERLAADNTATLDFLAVPIDHVLGVFQKIAPRPIRYHPGLREIVGAWRRQ